MSAVAPFVVGWSVGVGQLGAELLTLRDGAPPGSAAQASAAACLDACGVRQAIAEAVTWLPGAPPPPSNAPELGRFAVQARSWITSNLPAASILGRAARIGIAGAQLVHASTLVVALPDPGWLPHLRLDPLAASRAAADDGLTHLGLAMGYGPLPEPLGVVAASLRQGLTALQAPAAAFAFHQHQALARSLAQAWTGYAWAPPLRQALAAVPDDVGPAARQPELPPGCAPLAAQPMTSSVAAPAAAAIETTPVRRRLVPPEPRLPLRQVLERFGRKEVAIDTALRALLEHETWLAPAGLAVDPARVKEKRDGELSASIDVGILLLGRGPRPPAEDLWIFSDVEATTAIMAKMPPTGLGPYAKDLRGVELFPKLMAQEGIEKLRINPGSAQEHTFAIGRDAYGVVRMMCVALELERLAATTSPRDPAFRAAFLGAPGIATHRFKDSKAFLTLRGDWAPPFLRPAIAFTMPDVARAHLEKLTPETRERLEQVVPTPLTLVEVLLEEGHVDGLVLNPFGPGGALHLSLDDMRYLAAGMS